MHSGFGISLSTLLREMDAFEALKEIIWKVNYEKGKVANASASFVIANYLSKKGILC